VTGQDFLLGDASKANKELGWKPRYDFQVYISFCVATVWWDGEWMYCLL